jgi:hypothetical protein
MEWSLVRKFFNENYTIGKLMIDGEQFCDTLEDTVRDLKDYDHDGKFDNKIYGQTAIPCGRYQVIVTWSPKFGKRLPELLSVPGFTNIRIHSGVDAKHTEGCILVGNNRAKGKLFEGGYFQSKLVEMIDNSDEKCYITVKE